MAAPKPQELPIVKLHLTSPITSQSGAVYNFIDLKKDRANMSWHTLGIDVEIVPAPNRPASWSQHFFIPWGNVKGVFFGRPVEPEPTPAKE